MTNFNGKIISLSVVVLIAQLPPGRPSSEISSLLDEATDLTNNEITALRPLFANLQLQYDFIATKTPESNLISDAQYEQYYEEFEQLLNYMFPQAATTFYNYTWPTVEEIMGTPDLDQMTKEQQLEVLDLQSIFQDTLDEMQTDLNDLIARAQQLETSLLKINTPKVVTIIFKSLIACYKAAARVGRPAYCIYSSVPQLNTSLHTLYEGADCYLFTTSLIVKIQHETYHTVKTAEKNIRELATIYKKVARKNTLMGKIVSVILNITNIAGNISNTLRTTKRFLDGIVDQLPETSQQVLECGRNFAIKVSFIIQTVSNITECVLFVDHTTTDYDFMKPEEEYYTKPHLEEFDIVYDME